MKRIFISALALLGMGVMANAQEKVTIHNGSESYVTNVEYITFDATDADEAVSVSALQTEITTLTEEKTTLEGQVSTLTSEKAELASAKTTLEGQVSTLTSEKTALETKAKSMEYALGERAKVHEYVDLGLTSGTLWATMNVGASSPEDNGDYFAWGETYPKSDYSWSTYFDTNDGGNTCDKYNRDGGKIELEDVDDVAVQAWGGAWRTPTVDQQIEILKECYWVWTTRYNDKSVNGYIVYKAKTEDDKGVIYSGNAADASYDVATDAHIFLPTAGGCWDTKIQYVGSYGKYWSSTLYAFGSTGAWYMEISRNDNEWYCNGRYTGQSVRPVCPGK